MNTVLLTWNPGPSDELIYTPDEWLDAMVEPLRSGRQVVGTWSVAQHVNHIEPGDTAFMYRQGQCGRGIVARGIVRSFPWEGQHWAKPDDTTNYVDVEWEGAVPVDLRIDVEELEVLVPDFKWRQVYSSGRVMPERDGAKLTDAWTDQAALDSVHA